MNQPSTVIAPATIYGLVPDDVVGLDVVDSEGETTSAPLARNSFFLELPTTQAWAETLVVRYGNGTSRIVTLPGEPPVG